MVKTSFVLSSFYLFFFPEYETNAHHTDIQIALPLGFFPWVLLDYLPAPWVPSMETASWAHGVSRAVTSD